MPRHITPSGRGLGWRPQLPDHRDHVYAVPHEIMAVLPPSMDLRATGFLPPVYDQGQIGSCTGNAIAAALQYDRGRQASVQTVRVPSRLMIYYLEREEEGTVLSDAGGVIRDGIKLVGDVGACFEDGADGWPYDVGMFTQRPPQACYDAAYLDRALTYSAVPQTAQQLRGCLATGDTFVFGFTCYPELDSPDVASSGLLPLPAPSSSPMGGHAVLAVGYDDALRCFLIRNSWGVAWGLGGYFWMPYEYMLRQDLASDFWVIRTVS